MIVCDDWPDWVAAPVPDLERRAVTVNEGDADCVLLVLTEADVVFDPADVRELEVLGVTVEEADVVLDARPEAVVGEAEVERVALVLAEIEGVAVLLGDLTADRDPVMELVVDADIVNIGEGDGAGDGGGARVTLADVVIDVIGLFEMVTDTVTV